MTKVPTTLYLQRRTYRRRRLMDAARLLPVFGVLLFLVPLFWGSGEGDSAATARGVIYVFAIWALLIVISAGISTRLMRGEKGNSDPDRKE